MGADHPPPTPSQLLFRTISLPLARPLLLLLHFPFLFLPSRCSFCSQSFFFGSCIFGLLSSLILYFSQRELFCHFVALSDGECLDSFFFSIFNISRCGSFSYPLSVSEVLWWEVRAFYFFYVDYQVLLNFFYFKPPISPVPER